MAGPQPNRDYRDQSGQRVGVLGLHQQPCATLGILTPFRGPGAAYRSLSWALLTLGESCSRSTGPSSCDSDGLKNCRPQTVASDYKVLQGRGRHTVVGLPRTGKKRHQKTTPWNLPFLAPKQPISRGVASSYKVLRGALSLQLH
jgi:hypothetical protein